MKRQKEAKAELDAFLKEWAVKHKSPLKEGYAKAKQFINELGGTGGGYSGAFLRSLDAMRESSKPLLVAPLRVPNLPTKKIVATAPLIVSPPSEVS